MRPFALVALAAVLLLSMIGAACPQSYGNDRPRHREPDRPRPYYRGRFYQGPGYYRPGRYRTWNGCERGWTVQNGLCKPIGDTSSRCADPSSPHVQRRQPRAHWRSRSNTQSGQASGFPARHSSLATTSSDFRAAPHVAPCDLPRPCFCRHHESK